MKEKVFPPTTLVPAPSFSACFLEANQAIESNFTTQRRLWALEICKVMKCREMFYMENMVALDQYARWAKIIR